MGLRLHSSARKHQRRDKLTEGRLLGLQVLIFDSGDELVIHAMKARKQYLSLLDPPASD